MDIAVEKPDAADVAALLDDHVAEARALTPEAFSFALPGNALLADNITFWTARENGVLLGFAALKELGAASGEVKSMRTAPAHMRKGVGASLLAVIITQARTRAYQALYLETGVTDAYLPARALYEKHGFAPCAPFADYKASEHNWYMKLSLN